MTQEGAFLVRLSEKGGAECPFTLCVLHKGEPFNIQIRKRADRKFALGSKKDKETVSASHAPSHSAADTIAIFMSYFLAFVFILLLSGFNMFGVLYDMLVALVALCHL